MSKNASCVDTALKIILNYNNSFKGIHNDTSIKKIKMIRLLEKYPKVSWFFVVLIATAIFYISSLTFLPGPPIIINVRAIFYHLFAFFLLTFFLLPAIVKGKNKALIFVAIIIAVFYAVSDEFHQLFVPGRVSSFTDFLIDSAGVLIASFAYTISLRVRKKER